VAKKPDTIRAAVVAAARERGLNPLALSRLIGTDRHGKPLVSDDTIRRYLAGTHDTTTEAADRMLKALGVPGPTVRE
jgi:phosphoenolpyruvate carboxylase